MDSVAKIWPKFQQPISLGFGQFLPPESTRLNHWTRQWVGSGLGCVLRGGQPNPLRDSGLRVGPG